jgi:hypothetical protein
MYTQNGTIILERIVRFSHHDKHTSTVDITESRVDIPNREIVRLYECLKLVVERRGLDWKDYCDRLFEDDNSTGIDNSHIDKD